MSCDWFESLGPWTGSGEFDLTRMRMICNALGNVQDSVPCFHVAGTNGKGSASAAIAAILGHAGLSVGLNTSPHLENYTERFLINGTPITTSALSEAIAPVREAAQALGEAPSFHEGATLVAFSAFKALDRAVYEVGLGGRLDSSNVIKAPLVSVITSIALDHQAILGNTVEKIAYEKAGIIKTGIPVVAGNVPDQALKVIRQVAEEQGTKVYHFGTDFELSSSGNVFRYKSINYSAEFSCELSGKFQLSNLGCAIKACELSGIDINIHATGLKSLFWPGRMETIEYGNKEVLIDCAHNAQGISVLLKELSYRELEEVTLIFGMLRRPDWKEIVSQLAKEAFKFLLVTAPGERGIAARELKEVFLKHNARDVHEFDYDYRGVLEYSKQNAAKQIVVAGSIYLVGAFRPLLGCKPRPVWKREKN